MKTPDLKLVLGTQEILILISRPPESVCHAYVMPGGLTTKASSNEVSCRGFICLNCGKSLSSITPDVLNQQNKHQNKIKSSFVPAGVSPVFSLWSFSYPSLGYSIFFPANRLELIPTCLPNKLRCNCLSELSASVFFFSPPRT